MKTSKKRTPTKKRKVQAEPRPGGLFIQPEDSLQHMENLSTEGLSVNGYYGAQQNMQGLLQLNLMEPPHDAYYASPESITGLGQLSSMPSSHGGFFGTQQSMHGLGIWISGHKPVSVTACRYAPYCPDDPNLRSSQLHTCMAILQDMHKKIQS